MATPEPMPDRQPDRAPQQNPMWPRVPLPIDEPDELVAYGDITPKPKPLRARGRGPADGNIVAGQVLMFVTRDDRIGSSILADIEADRISGVQQADSLEDILTRTGLSLNSQLNFSLHLLAVPPGEEGAVGRRLEERYNKTGGATQLDDRPESLRFAALPNPAFAVAGHPTMAYYQAKHFRFGPVHREYKEMLRSTASASAASTAQPTILILDSGLAEDVPFHVLERRSFIEGTDPRGLDDYHHGTAIAMIVNDLNKNVGLKSYKVIDGDGVAGGFHVLAPLCSETHAQIVNLSIEYVSDPAVVTVMRTIISAAAAGPRGPIVVAAAGNSGAGSYGAPACIPEVFAISSITSRRELSTFSCYGGKDAYGNRHEMVFASPGGERNARNLEYVATFSEPKAHELWGTSFAAAYASATIAATWSKLGLSAAKEDVLNALIAGADKNLEDYSYDQYGHGMPTWP